MTTITRLARNSVILAVVASSFAGCKKKDGPYEKIFGTSIENSDDVISYRISSNGEWKADYGGISAQMKKGKSRREAKAASRKWIEQLTEVLKKAKYRKAFKADTKGSYRFSQAKFYRKGKKTAEMSMFPHTGGYSIMEVKRNGKTSYYRFYETEAE